MITSKHGVYASDLTAWQKLEILLPFFCRSLGSVEFWRFAKQVSRSTANWIFVTPLAIAVLLFILLTKPALIGGNALFDEIVDLIGFLIIIKGLVIRIIARDWKSTHIHEGLVTSGPYAIARNPMYIGSYFLGLGLFVIIGNLYFGLAFTAIYAVVHIFIAKGEERFLTKEFSSLYDDYKSKVPAFIPSPAKLLRAVITGGPWVSSKKSAIVKELGTICSVLIGAFLLELREAYSKHSEIEIGIFGALAVAVALIWVVCAIKSKSKETSEA